MRAQRNKIRGNIGQEEEEKVDEKYQMEKEEKEEEEEDEEMRKGIKRFTRN